MDFDAILILFSIVGGLLKTFWLFLFGRLTTERFGQMADCLFESNWPKLPINLQKNIRIIIQNAQRPLYYHGLQIVTLNLESFVKVLFSSLTCNLYQIGLSLAIFFCDFRWWEWLHRFIWFLKLSHKHMNQKIYCPLFVWNKFNKRKEIKVAK